MLMRLGKRPMLSAGWSLTPIVVAVASFVLLRRIEDDVWFSFGWTIAIMFAATFLLIVTGRSFGSWAGVTAATFVFFGFAMTGLYAILMLWGFLSLVLSVLAAQDFTQRDKTAGGIDRFVFELVLWNGFFWSLYCVFWTYSYGDPIRSYFATALGLLGTAGILLVWSWKASRKVHRNR